tara:strand:- start:2983 stop:5973 length:2991 start_codon:yes stop_codon:yes gene_type:complete
MNKSHIEIVYLTAFLLLLATGFFQFESISDNSLGVLLLVIPVVALYILNKLNNRIGNNLNIAIPIMNKYSITKQKSISVIIGEKNSGKSSILKNNNYAPIPEDKLTGPKIGQWWQLENEMFFELDIDKDFKPELSEFITPEDDCWKILLNKLQQQLLPYSSIKNLIIVFPVQVLHQSHAPLKSYISNVKKLLSALHNNAGNTKLNLVFSHCESVQGFQSFFYDLGRDSKLQLLTVNKANNESKLSLANIFTTKFTKIIEVLQQQMFTRLRQEHDLAKKIEIKDFPLQLEALIKPINELLITIETISPNKTQGIYFCSNYNNHTGHNIYDFIHNSKPILVTKQQILLMNNTDKYHCYFNSNIITNINAIIKTKEYDKKYLFTISMLAGTSIVSAILFKKSYDNYNITNNITNKVESMIAVKVNNNNSEIDRLYLALKYLSDTQNTKNINPQTENLRTHLHKHYSEQLNITLPKEITNKINQYFATKLENNESIFPQYINTKLVFINEPIEKKREWLQQLLRNSSHHKYLQQHIENLAKIEFPIEIETRINQKLYSFSMAEKVMMLVNKPTSNSNMHIGFPDEVILSNANLNNIITEQIPAACNKLALSKELKAFKRQECIHASAKHYLLEYMNMWQYLNATPQIENYANLEQLNNNISSLLNTGANLKASLAKVKVVMNTLHAYNDPQLEKLIMNYNKHIKSMSSWAKLLSDNELNKTLTTIINTKPDYENYYTATVQYYKKSPLSQMKKLEHIAANQNIEQRQWLKSITDQALTFYENKAYTYLDNIWQQTVYNIYQKKIANKFPIISNSTSEMSLRDFEQFFSADGIFQTYLSLVEPLINSKLISSNNRQAFVLSRKIANSWFVNNHLSLKLTMIPIDLTANATNFYLEIGNNKLTFDKNNLKTTTIDWPHSGDDLVTMEFTNKSGQSTIMNKNSEWALLKLLQEAEIKPLMSKNQFYITFKKDAFSAKYQTITQNWFNIEDITKIARFSLSEHL